MPSLGPNQINVLRRASSAAIVTALGRLNRYTLKSNWIAASNRYRFNTVENLLLDANANSVKQKALVDYIAASAPLHCADGWSFLARAVGACERGNSAIAVHLGYYAELRAAMSILASQGIGVFDKKHYVVETPSSVLPLNGRTHVFTWEALESWASLPQSGQELLKIFSVRGKSLGSWLTAYQPATSLSATVAATWLKRWGLDLQLVANDQDVRNEASYRPNDLAVNPAFDAVAASRMLTDFWKLSEPSVLPFDLLDRHLLKTAIQRIFKGANPTLRIRSAQYRAGVRSMLSALGISSIEGPQMVGFLERAEVPLLIKLAESKYSRLSSTQHLEVLARATLMLRVATGFCSQLMSTSSLDRSTINFWLEAFGETRGLWAPGNKPQNLIELWDVIRTAVIDEESWIAAKTPEAVSVSDWRTGRADTLLPLTQCEYVMLWGMFP